MSKVRITKQFTFETGHALYGHDGKCKNIHGHSYKLSVTIFGKPLGDSKSSKFGMIMDFSDLKKIVKEEIVTARFAFGSVSATQNIKKGEIISKKNIFPKRPGNGFYTADDYYKLLGKKTKKNILVGNQLKKGDV